MSSDQELWDQMLLQSWQAFGRVGMLCKQFLDQTGGNAHVRELIQQLTDIKRAPRSPADLGKPVRAFVDQTMPRLNNILWDGKHSHHDVLALMVQLEMDTQSIPIAARQKRMRKRYHKHRGLAQKLGSLAWFDDAQQRNRMSGHVQETASKKNRKR